MTKLWSFTFCKEISLILSDFGWFCHNFCRRHLLFLKFFNFLKTSEMENVCQKSLKLHIYFRYLRVMQFCAIMCSWVCVSVYMFFCSSLEAKWMMRVPPCFWVRARCFAQDLVFTNPFDATSGILGKSRKSAIFSQKWLDFREFKSGPQECWKVSHFTDNRRFL